MIAVPPRWLETISVVTGRPVEKLKNALILRLLKTEFVVGQDKSRLLPFQIFVGFKVPERREKKD